MAIMVAEAGFKPATFRLTCGCSCLPPQPFFCCHCHTSISNSAQLQVHIQSREIPPVHAVSPLQSHLLGFRHNLSPLSNIIIFSCAGYPYGFRAGYG